MGFGGGGGGELANHVHDNTPLQGGPLNFSNTTIASLANGDMTYSNGAALQALTIGAANTVIQSVGGIPSWQTLPLASSVLTTAGDLLIENATPALDRLPAGNLNDVLTMGAALPEWSAPSAADSNFIVGSMHIVPISQATIRCGGLWQNDFDTSHIPDSAVSIPLYFDWELNRIEFKNTTNTMNGDALFYFRDDGSTIGTVTITSASTGLFSSGALAVAVASGSYCNWKMDTLAYAFGTLNDFVTAIAYGKST